MKQLLFALLLSPLAAGAQVTLEKSYATAYQTQVVYIENEGAKYFNVSDQHNKAYIYNADHSVWKTINLNLIGGVTHMHPTPALVSKYLFDSDAEIEFLVTYYVGATSYTDLINEDGTLIKRFNNCVYADLLHVNNDWKLLATISGSSHVYTDVYALPGQYTGILPQDGKESPEASLYPNPVETSATLRYSLPNGTHTGSIKVYNSAGAMVRNYTVSSQHDNILIYKNELPAGVYTYSVSAPGYQAVADKFIIR